MNAEVFQMADKEKKTDKRRTIIGIVATYVLMVLVNIILSNAFSYIIINGVSIPFYVYGTVVELGIVMPAIIYTVLKGESITESFGFRKIRVKTVLWTMLLTILSFPLYTCANVLSQIFVPNTAIESASEMSGSIFGSWFVVTIVASLCEEIAIRGFCFNRLKKVSSLFAAAAISAIMFGVLHLNINQICYAMVLGFIFALANFASGSIWTSIIMHTIINSFGYVVVMIAELATASAGINLEETAELQRTQTSSFLTTGLVLFVISIGCAFLIKMVLKKIAVSENNQEAMGVFGVK